MSTFAGDHRNGYEVFNVVWRGIELEIHHKKNWAVGFDHIETNSRDNAHLPITETGYKSLFLLPEQIAEHGTAVDHVLAWLEHEAQSERWKRFEAESQQLSLF